MRKTFLFLRYGFEITCGAVCGRIFAPPFSFSGRLNMRSLSFRARLFWHTSSPPPAFWVPAAGIGFFFFFPFFLTVVLFFPPFWPAAEKAVQAGNR